MKKKKKEKKILRIFDRNLIESCHTISFRSWIILRVTMRMIPLRIIVANFQDVEMQLYYPPLPRSVVRSIVIVRVHARALSTFHVTSFETRGSRLIERETVIDSCTKNVHVRIRSCNNLNHVATICIYIYIFIYSRVIISGKSNAALS